MSQKYSQKTQLEILREVVEHGEYCMSEIDLTDTVRKWNYDWLVGEGCINTPTANDDDPGMRVDYHKGLTDKGETLLYQLSEQFRKEGNEHQMFVMTWQIRGLTLGLCLMTLILLVLTWILVCR